MGETYPHAETASGANGGLGQLNQLRAYLDEQWTEGFAHRELYLLNFYFCNRLAAVIRDTCVWGADGALLSSGNITPELYLDTADGLLRDCQSGIDGQTGEPMHMEVRGIDTAKSQELEHCILGWALPAFGADFAYQLLLVREQRIGQESLV